MFGFEGGGRPFSYTAAGGGFLQLHPDTVCGGVNSQAKHILFLKNPLKVLKM